MEIQVYAEQVLLDNFITDFTLLWCVKRLMHEPIALWRILTAAGIGAVAALIMPIYEILGSLVFKALILVLICFTAYFKKSIKKLVKYTLCFLILSMTIAGLSVIGTLLFNIELYVTPVSFYTTSTVTRSVFLCTAIALLTGLQLPQFINKLNLKNNMTVKVNITTNEGTKELNAFVDTGHSLVEPITKLPVVITQYNDIKELLNKELDLAINGQMNHCRETVYIIPYRCIGKESGVLFGFKPKEFIIKNKNKAEGYECILAIAIDFSAVCQNHSVLLHPMMLRF